MFENIKNLSQKQLNDLKKEISLDNQATINEYQTTQTIDNITYQLKASTNVVKIWGHKIYIQKNIQISVLKNDNNQTKNETKDEINEAIENLYVSQDFKDFVTEYEKMYKKNPSFKQNLILDINTTVTYKSDDKTNTLIKVELIPTKVKVNNKTQESKINNTKIYKYDSEDIMSVLLNEQQLKQDASLVKQHKIAQKFEKQQQRTFLTSLNSSYEAYIQQVKEKYFLNELDTNNPTPKQLARFYERIKNLYAQQNEKYIQDTNKIFNQSTSMQEGKQDMRVILPQYSKQTGNIELNTVYVSLKKDVKNRNSNFGLYKEMQDTQTEQLFNSYQELIQPIKTSKGKSITNFKKQEEQINNFLVNLQNSFEQDKQFQRTFLLKALNLNEDDNIVEFIGNGEDLYVNDKDHVKVYKSFNQSVKSIDKIDIKQLNSSYNSPIESSQKGFTFDLEVYVNGKKDPIALPINFRRKSSSKLNFGFEVLSDSLTQWEDLIIQKDENKYEDSIKEVINIASNINAKFSNNMDTKITENEKTAKITNK